MVWPTASGWFELGPLEDGARHLLQRRALRDAGDLEDLADSEVLVAAAPSLRLDAGSANRAAHAARVQSDEAGCLRERR